MCWVIGQWSYVAASVSLRRLFLLAPEKSAAIVLAEAAVLPRNGGEEREPHLVLISLHFAQYREEFGRGRYEHNEERIRAHSSMVVDPLHGSRGAHPATNHRDHADTRASAERLGRIAPLIVWLHRRRVVML